MQSPVFGFRWNLSGPDGETQMAKTDPKDCVCRKIMAIPSRGNC